MKFKVRRILLNAPLSSLNAFAVIQPVMTIRLDPKCTKLSLCLPIAACSLLEPFASSLEVLANKLCSFKLPSFRADPKANMLPDCNRQ